MTSALKDCPYEPKSAERRAWAEGHGHGLERGRREAATLRDDDYRAGFDDGLEAALANIAALICGDDDPLHALLDRETVIEALGYAAQIAAGSLKIRPQIEEAHTLLNENLHQSWTLNTRSKKAEIDAVQAAIYSNYSAADGVLTRLPNPQRLDGREVYYDDPALGEAAVASLFPGGSGQRKADWGHNKARRTEVGEKLALRLARARRGG